MGTKKITLSDLEREEREELQLEIKARKELARRLEHPLKLIETAAKKEQQKRQERIEHLTEYKSYNEAQEAYGWEMITEEEFDEIVRILEEGTERIEKERTPVEIAKDILNKFVNGLIYEIASFEFDLLPEEEKARVREKNEEILARRAARDAARNAAGEW
jgi:DNA-binding ferritin-like protein (Dps family)